jgi:NAD(P)H-hydrate repair Nnr-like enzyme with NAD(P)H-hydrate epimerase domain
MSLPFRLGALAALALAAVLIAGCGGVNLDAGKEQDQLKQYVENLEGAKVSAVDCPSGVEVKAGNTFECSLTLRGGKQGTVTVKILNSNADTAVTDLRFNK